MKSPPYRIRANVFPSAAERRGGRGEDDHINACAISLYLFDREPKSAVEQLLREYTTPGPPGWPAVLGDALEFLRGVCESFLGWDYQLRVDLGRHQTSVEVPDVPINGIDDLRDLLSRLSAARCDGLIYPVQLWAFEQTKAKQAMKAIDAFRLIRFDKKLADSIYDLGCITLDVFPEYMDVWLPCAKLNDMRSLLKDQAARLQVKMDWKENAAR